MVSGRPEIQDEPVQLERTIGYIDRVGTVHTYLEHLASQGKIVIVGEAVDANPGLGTDTRNNQTIHGLQVTHVFVVLIPDTYTPTAARLNADAKTLVPLGIILNRELTIARTTDAYYSSPGSRPGTPDEAQKLWFPVIGVVNFEGRETLTTTSTAKEYMRGVLAEAGWQPTVTQEERMLVTGLVIHLYPNCALAQLVKDGIGDDPNLLGRVAFDGLSTGIKPEQAELIAQGPAGQEKLLAPIRDYLSRTPVMRGKGYDSFLNS
ncbi:hypothetical protein A2Z00_01465 [Candidatus Gottesmanbacteria bacterium RBG_13_45_10]|uniref:Uncharacterized protein n=1 Tax=Candidatus Gottesmanbacteria bacterium RBG_13_45_10 TaxID=1798370 RepID=A0A1F5ZHP7_9BACT|nr:MAG: hypothetical protein A2Z00_01465 [Candidatus Gottesmanbacteria bacterium RBG_13_45_10]